ncbi:SNF1-related protein kinase catalytic subunit alpha KIN10-like [Andrographis paniculata]|uniref:SNF1-related protein kinase catalytic subunit alpha KIN10-like n=1 Tax=Andrographis paniculata TaxID=175694 RepID=UPI0021E88EC5|nr:SNF1-related protein kinase catalytic subunit alpha KIN10-like [Andrographis paniculata]XP_051151136.1 SNF1-related protein kinase catalytic subunit alpha KIN10-like [Andrographis paniculata]XP_051151143.1 SNF1-related protein kinase catalytic subunit alpha KIN10-like [Andrographis paniculata]
MESSNGMSASSCKKAMLPRYKLGKTLGHGAFGKVKLAVHTLTGIKVAIKILERQSIDEYEAQKVRKEIDIMRQLFHPHIVRLFEVVDTPANVYVVMEYMDSGELFYYLTENGKLHEDEARHFFQQIISGVEYCHRHLVVHRDLKPENLLLDSDRNVKIADFGLGNIMRDGHFLKTCCGSPNYAAPELISRRLYAGPEVDVWSCGVILYALLCGRLPFDDDNIPGLYAKIKNGVYPAANHVSESGRDLISRILVVDPMRRISIPEIRRHPWFRRQLPRYISMSSPNASGGTEKIEIDAVKEMVRMGFDGREVIVSIQNHLHNEATVAYSMLLHSFSREQGMQLDNPIKENRGHSDAAQMVTTLTATPPVLPGSNNWTLGFKSLASPNETMSDVLKVFHGLNVRWKRIGHYNMKCLWLPPSAVDAIKFEIQLYKASGEKYVLDMQQLNGPPFIFLDICAAFQAQVVV